MDKLSTFFTLMAAMSIAAERVVEIIKGIVPSLAATDSDVNKERRRHMVLQFLAALACIVVGDAAHVQVNSSLGDFLNSAYDAWSLPGMGLMTVKYVIIGRDGQRRVGNVESRARHRRSVENCRGKESRLVGLRMV